MILSQKRHETHEIRGEAHQRVGCPYPTKKELVLVADVIVDLPDEGDVFAEGSAPRKTAGKRQPSKTPKKAARVKKATKRVTAARRNKKAAKKKKTSARR
jgi:hypothetical protein